MKKKAILGLLIFTLAAAGFVRAETETYTILRRLSELKFDVSAQLHNVHGESKEFTGTITGDRNDITTAHISVKLDPKSFNTQNDKRDKDMREKSLEVQKYPYIEFESKSIQAENKVLKPGQPTKATITGILKLHGLEKEISVPVTILLNDDTLTVDGSLGVVLDEYKIFRPKVLFVRLQNDVKIQFKIGARKVAQ
jgi:polyisoprenoid-binding protein YceI